MGMKKIQSVFLIALLVLTVLGVTGVLLFRYFVADQIMDNGGTMNTDNMDGSETPFILDGFHCLLERLGGQLPGLDVKGYGLFVDFILLLWTISRNTF